MSMAKVGFIMMVAFALSGCMSRTGPYVTSISSDGRGGLIVDKCMVTLNKWWNTMETDACSSSYVMLVKP